MFPAPYRDHRSEFHLYQNCGTVAKSFCNRAAGISNAYTRARLAAGSVTDLPRPPRHCCHATSMGAATAMEE